MAELTDRELEVARLAAAGTGATEIGLMLHCSMHTVKVHLRRIYSKLGISGRHSQVTLAARRSELDGLVAVDGRRTGEVVKEV